MYGIRLVPFESLPKADCVIAAVGHSMFRKLGAEGVRKLFRENADAKKVLLDVKGIFPADELRQAGISLWRL